MTCDEHSHIHDHTPTPTSTPCSLAPRYGCTGGRSCLSESGSAPGTTPSTRQTTRRPRSWRKVGLHTAQSNHRETWSESSQVKSTVVRSVPAEDLVPACESLGDPHRPLDRLGARRREHERVDVARHDVCQQLRPTDDTAAQRAQQTQQDKGRPCARENKRCRTMKMSTAICSPGPRKWLLGTSCAVSAVSAPAPVEWW